MISTKKLHINFSFKAILCHNQPKLNTFLLRVFQQLTFRILNHVIPISYTFNNRILLKVRPRWVNKLEFKSFRWNLVLMPNLEFIIRIIKEIPLNCFLKEWNRLLAQLAYSPHLGNYLLKSISQSIVYLSRENSFTIVLGRLAFLSRSIWY